MTDSVDRVLVEMRAWLDGMPFPLWKVGLVVLACVLLVYVYRGTRR